MLLQLLVFPSRGWEAIAISLKPFNAVVIKGFLPLVGITALSEFVPLAYYHDLTFIKALGNAIAIGGGMYASLFASRLFLEMVLTRSVGVRLNHDKISNVALYLMGLNCLYVILSNIIPGTLTFLLFIPMLSLLVLFKSTLYMGIDEDRSINYLIFSFIGVVAVPAFICWLLTLIL